MPVLGHDQRAAVGGVAAVLGRVLARLERQLAGMRPGGHGDAIVAGREAGDSARPSTASATRTKATIRAGPTGLVGLSFHGRPFWSRSMQRR